MIATPADISSIARSTKAVSTDHRGCGSSAKATGTTCGTNTCSAESASAKMAENSRKSFQAGFIEFIELSRVIGCGISMTWRDCLAFDVDQIRAQLLRLRILW